MDSRISASGAGSIKTFIMSYGMSSVELTWARVRPFARPARIETAGLSADHQTMYVHGLCEQCAADKDAESGMGLPWERARMMNEASDRLGWMP